MTEPVWLAYARRQLGTREAPGPANDSRVMAMATRAKQWLGIGYHADSVPWCGLFVSDCMQAAGMVAPRGAVAVRASWWETWGVPVSPRVGSILTFRRPGGGHVAFYVGEDAATYHVLGGNQSDAVTITRIAKNRMTASRWPVGVPVTTAPVSLAGRGVVSENEA